MPPKQQTKKSQKPKSRSGQSKSSGDTPFRRNTVLQKSTYNITSKGPSQINVRGHEYLGQVRTGSASMADSTLSAVFDLNPSCWKDSRLNLIAQAYEKYRYNRFRLIYVPAASANTWGTVTLAVETDPEERIPVGTGFEARVMNYQFASMGQCSERVMLEYRRDPQDGSWYFSTQTGHPTRTECSQGIVFAHVSGAADTVFGGLLIEYDIDFLYPELEYSDGGAQYKQAAVDLVPTTVANQNAEANMTAAQLPTNTKLVEIRVANNLVSMNIGGGSNWYDPVAGSLIYAALIGTQWLLFPALDMARSGANPLKISNIQTTGLNVGRFVRPLIAGLTQR